MHIFPNIQACWRSWPRHCGDPMTSVPLWHNLRWEKLCTRATGTLSCRGMGKHWKTPRWYGIPSDSSQGKPLRGRWHLGWQCCGHTHSKHGSLPWMRWQRNSPCSSTYGDNWAYTFVQLNEDAQHVPLSNEGHLSAMVNGAPCRNACGHLCQLEVHKLLQCGDQVVYPKGLNRGLQPVQTLLSGSLIWAWICLGNSPMNLHWWTSPK